MVTFHTLIENLKYRNEYETQFNILSEKKIETQSNQQIRDMFGENIIFLQVKDGFYILGGSIDGHCEDHKHLKKFIAFTYMM